jgi:pimeloyl-ACP methyl ester carboxylesterase
MPYANNQGVHIHYQVVGKGAPLVLLHGLFASWVDWYEAGYVAALKDNYQLLLIDGRGHGASDKPHEPEAYAMKFLVNDIIAVLDAMNVAKAHFLGYSWGGCIGYGVGQYVSERFQSLIIGGHAPQRGNPQVVSFFIEHLQAGVEAFASLLDQGFGPSPSAYKALRLASDFEACIAATLAWRDYSDFDAWLPNITVPCLLYVGEADGSLSLLKESARRIPHSNFVSLPGLDHAQAFTHSDLVLPHIFKFLLEVS